MQARGGTEAKDVYTGARHTLNYTIVTPEREDAEKMNSDLQNERNERNERVDGCTLVGSGGIALSPVVLVSCVARKRVTPQPAQELYISLWYRAARICAERLIQWEGKGAWLILSAKYGVLDPIQTITPYDETLARMSSTARQQWGVRVLEALHERIDPTRDAVILFCGARYRAPILPALQVQRVVTLQPLAHLGIGQQVHWLRQHRSDATWYQQALEAVGSVNGEGH